jgi:hypothetical protein
MGDIMIEFKGEITGKALIYQANRYKILFSISFLIAGFLVCILYQIYSLFIPTLFIVFVFLLLPAKFWSFLAPLRVYIDLEEKTIVSQKKGAPETFRMIDDIIEVKDHEDFYTFKFYSPRNQLNFIVQKDLLTQGTIEEFEEIFKEVLVRVK